MEETEGSSETSLHLLRDIVLVVVSDSLKLVPSFDFSSPIKLSSSSAKASTLAAWYVWSLWFLRRLVVVVVVVVSSGFFSS